MPRKEGQPLGSPEEVDLLVRLHAHDADALLAVYRLYGPRLFMLALRILEDRSAAEEIVQDTFWKLWQRPEMFDPQRGLLLAWLYKVGRNLALDRKRKEHRRITEYVLNEFDGYADKAADHSIRPLDDPSVLRAVRDAIASLPVEQKRAIELAYFEGMTQSEIADHAGLAVGTVKTRIRLALQKLRDALEGAGTDAAAESTRDDARVKR